MLRIDYVLEVYEGDYRFRALSKLAVLVGLLVPVARAPLVGDGEHGGDDGGEAQSKNECLRALLVHEAHGGVGVIYDQQNNHHPRDNDADVRDQDEHSPGEAKG